MNRVETGDWTEYRTLPDCIEVDFHYGRRDLDVPYWDAMADVAENAYTAILKAHALGLRYVLMTHGSSTSRPGQTTARSQIRGLIRSAVMTPYINRRECIQHYSCFVVALKPNPVGARRPSLRCPSCRSERIESRSTVEGAGYFKCLHRGCRRVFSWFDLVETPTQATETTHAK